MYAKLKSETCIKRFVLFQANLPVWTHSTLVPFQGPKKSMKSLPEMWENKFLAFKKYFLVNQVQLRFGYKTDKLHS